MTTFREDFDGPTLDRSVWFPHYLPAWSSRSETAATYRIADSSLRLFIPADAGLWCEEEHPEPIRVSGMATGNWSGPVGSSAGQQRFTDGLEVREEQTRFEGWLLRSGEVAVRCRMALSHRSMAAVWLAGFEVQPEHAGELCVVEVFGHTIESGSAAVGVGVKQLHDPALVHDFVSPRLEIDVATFHEYSVEWSAGVAEFAVDGVPTHRTRTAPSYPMQVMVAVFDFPAWSLGGDDHLVPELEIDWVFGVGD